MFRINSEVFSRKMRPITAEMCIACGHKCCRYGMEDPPWEEPRGSYGCVQLVEGVGCRHHIQAISCGEPVQEHKPRVCCTYPVACYRDVHFGEVTYMIMADTTCPAFRIDGVEERDLTSPWQYARSMIVAFFGEDFVRRVEAQYENSTH